MWKGSKTLFPITRYSLKLVSNGVNLVEFWLRTTMNAMQSTRYTNLFDEMDRKDTIIRNRKVLETTYLPDNFPHREEEVRNLAEILQPSLEGSKPSNILIYGQTGTGKTAITKYVCRHLSEKSLASEKRVIMIYVNCKQINTPYGILSRIGEGILDRKEDEIPIAGWRTEQIYEVVRRRIDDRKINAIIVLDEVDTIVEKSGSDILYHLTGMNADLINSKISLIGISNNIKFTKHIDPRVKSRLGEESITFAPYNAEQLIDILQQRAAEAFNEGIVQDAVIRLCAGRAAQEHGDARKALDLLRIAVDIAERDGAKSVDMSYVERADNRMEEDQVKKVILTLPLQHKAILSSIVLNEIYANLKPQSTGDVQEIYGNVCARFELTELTGRRVSSILSELEMHGLISTRLISYGRRGRTRIINLETGRREIRKIMKEDLYMGKMLEQANQGLLRRRQLRIA